MEKTEKVTVGTKLTSFMEKNKKAIICVFAVVVVAVIAFVAVSSISASTKVKNLAKLDEITYVLTKDAMNAEESVLADRLSAAKDSVAPYLNKGGVVGARANFIAAEVAVQQKNYKDALSYYEAAASKAGKSYLGSILTYNTASCYEMTGDLAKACELFKKAAADEDFLLRAHAQFNVGRICEAMGKANDAYDAYSELVNRKPDLEWSKVAKSRMLTLEIEGKVSK